MENSIEHKLAKPEKSLEDFVYCFSSVRNLSGLTDGVIIPNGRVDLSFSKAADGKFRVSLLGLETSPKRLPKQDISDFFAISFNPLGVEYILQCPIAPILNQEQTLADDVWGFSIEDLNDFDAFCRKASVKMESLLPMRIDDRKRKLFDLIFAADGAISVQELSGKIAWSARQINQYFKKQFGLSLKTYCNILRFQASLSHIKEGKLFPELNFYDQSHFIKEIKKLSGVSPKELHHNQNNRFLQFSAEGNP